MRRSLAGPVIGPVLLLLAFACSKEPYREPEPRPEGTPIQFSGMETKSGFSIGDSFRVWAECEDGTPLMNGQEVRLTEDGWTYSPLKYWPSGQTVTFIAATPSDGQVVQRNARNPEEYDIQIPYGAAADVLFSDYVTEEEGHTVKLEFHHILSRIAVKGRLREAPPAVKSVRIRNVILTDCASSGVWNTSLNRWQECTGRFTFAQYPATVIEGTESVHVADFYLPPSPDTTARLVIDWEIVHKTTGAVSLSKRDTVNLSGHTWHQGGNSIDFVLSLNGRSGLIEFIDDEAKATCVASFDTDGDGEISYDEAAAVRSLGTAFHHSQMQQFIELEYFTNITEIPEACFRDCNRLVKLVLPERIVSVGKGAFMDCASLPSITLPAQMTQIPDNLFNGCRSLRYNLPSNIVAIGDYAFKDCKSIYGINFPLAILRIGNFAFSGSGLITVELPHSNVSLGQGVFENCSALHWVAMNDYYTVIPNRTFSGCSNLSEFTFPGNITDIGEAAFLNCSRLVELEFPKSLSRIGSKAFAGCSQVWRITSKPTSAPTTQDDTFGIADDPDYPFTGSGVTEDKILRIKLGATGYAKAGWKVLTGDAGFAKRTVLGF